MCCVVSLAHRQPPKPACAAGGGHIIVGETTTMAVQECAYHCWFRCLLINLSCAFMSHVTSSQVCNNWRCLPYVHHDMIAYIGRCNKKVLKTKLSQGAINWHSQFCTGSHKMIDVSFCKVLVTRAEMCLNVCWYRPDVLFADMCIPSLF